MTQRTNGFLFDLYRKRLKCFFLCLFICVPIVSYAAASDSKELTLENAISIAVSNNPDLNGMKARYKALAEIPSQVGSLPDPMLVLNSMNLPTDSFDLDQEPMTQMQVGVRQAFPFPGKLSLKRKASEFQAIASSYSVTEVKNQIISHVKQSWWQIFYLDRAIEVIQSNQELMRQLLETARTKYEVGKGLQQDVLLAQLELSKLLDQEISVDSMREHAHIKLNVLMGTSPDIKHHLSKENPNVIASNYAESELYNRASAFRPSLLEKIKLKESAKSNLKLAKKGYLPDFNVGVVYGNRQGDNPPPRGGRRTDFVSVMINASIPLYAGSKQSREIVQRVNELENRKFQIHGEISKIQSEISMALADLNKAEKQYLLFKTGIVPQARQTVSSMLAAYQVNKVDFLNLVRSQITLLNYELQYWKAFTDSKMALAKITAAIGEDSTNE